MEGWRVISIPPVGVENRCSKQQNLFPFFPFLYEYLCFVLG